MKRWPGRSGRDVLSPGAARLAESAFLRANRERIFYSLALAGTLFLLPFSINNFVQGRFWLGIATTTVVICFIANALAVYRSRMPPVPAAFVFLPALAGLGISMNTQGLVGILWSYPSILVFHFILERRIANLFNLSIVLMATPFAYQHLGIELTARVVMTLLMTIAFTNIFSHVSETQQVKESEQRQRADLLVRATMAGLLDWNALSGAVVYSDRYKELLGYRADFDTSVWTNWFDMIHGEDLPTVQAVLREQLTDHSQVNAVRHHAPLDLRLKHASGNPLWVHDCAATPA